MNENIPNGLQRFDFDNKLPTGFKDLTKKEQREIVKKLQDQDIQLRGELIQKAGKSRIAEHDISVGIDTIQRLDHEKKIYSKKMSGETGSGTYELKIKGGDTKFIIPLLTVLGVVILGIVLIIALQ